MNDNHENRITGKTLHIDHFVDVNKMVSITIAANDKFLSRCAGYFLKSIGR